MDPPGSNGTLVGQVARDAALVALLGAPDEGGVENEAVLGCVSPCLQRSANIPSPTDVSAAGKQAIALPGC